MWINYGTITATIKSGSTVPGVVSSLHLQDSKGSSLNMDWVGLSSNRVQTYTYTNGQVQLSQAIAPILAVNATSTFVKYKIVWLPDSISWYANGLAIRTLYRKDTWSEGEQRFNYPSNAARLSFSIWDSSKSINPPMTQSWAGSISSAYPDGTKFDMQVQSVSIDCYSNSTANNQGSIPVLHGTSNTTSASASPQKPQSSSVPAPAASYDLSNFGLAPSAASSKSEKSSSSAPTARDSGGGDDVSKYLAANSRNAASLSRGAGLLTSSLAVFAVVVISSI
ncbi:concanavalin A-like lectin/glucanase [Martensiomyces pterosporus]|nr:concanavalin A-like lectin/glucanase [Martensiomyces pterosporus]